MASIESMAPLASTALLSKNAQCATQKQASTAHMLPTSLVELVKIEIGFRRTAPVMLIQENTSVRDNKKYIGFTTFFIGS